MAVKKRQPKTKRIFKKKPCRLCKNKIESVEYKEVEALERYVSDRGKIVPARVTGNCAKHQRMIANGIKRARIAGLLPFVKAKQGAQREGYSSRRR